MLNADPDRGGKMNADLDPQPWCIARVADPDPNLIAGSGLNL